MHVLVSCRNKEDQIKMKALECLHHFSHCKSMGIFSDAQEQLTPLSKVGSGRILISSETVWLSSLPARMKKNQSNIKALVFTTLYIDFSDAQGR